MSAIEMERLSDDARIWVFGVSPALGEPEGNRLLRRVDAFLETWAAHGVPISAARQLLYGSFLIIAVDKQSETSGCSIDRMFGLFREMESELGVEILDSGRIFYRGADGGVHAITRAKFRESGDPHTLVFDTTAERIGAVRNGTWERPAAKSWHAALLARGTSEDS